MRCARHARNQARIRSYDFVDGWFRPLPVTRLIDWEGLLEILRIFMITNYSFSLTVVTFCQTSQSTGESLKPGILYFLGFTPELLSQFSLLPSCWVNPMNTA